MNKVITGLVALAVLALGYVTIKSVLNPVQFDAKQAEREAILQKQLKKIASYEEAYQSIHGRFATAEELADFLANGRLFYIRAEGEVTEAMREQGLTEAEAARRGMIKRDTVWVSAKDSLLKDGTDATKLFDVLATGNKIKIDTAYIQQEIGKDTVNISTVQATIPFEFYLSDLDAQRLEQKKDALKKKVNSFPGLRLGSLTEVRLTGNWE